MALKDQLFISSVWTDDDVRVNNTTGSPVSSAAMSGSGEEISDQYGIVMSAVSAGTGTATVSASVNNPYNGRVVTGVPLDGSTAVKNVIPGISLVFSAGTANGNASTVIIGGPYGPFDASGIDAGVPTAGVRHRVHNTSDNSVSDAEARLLPQVVQVKMTGKVFDSIVPFAAGATEKTAGGGSSRVMPYALTISSTAGAGGSKTASLSVDTVLFGADTILDLTTGLTQNGALLKALGSTYPYVVISGPLTGMQFSIDPACINADKANVLIFSSRYVQIASDASGVEGTYGAGPVVLTEAGQSAGVITSDGVAYYWSRFVVPSSANNESNPYPCNVALAASESTSAGWGA